MKKCVMSLMSVVTVAATLGSISFPSVASAAEKAAGGQCVLERQRLIAMNAEVESVQRQMEQAKFNGTTTAINGVVSLLFWGANFMQDGKLNMGPAFIASADVGLTGYSLYLSKQNFDFYSALAKQVSMAVNDLDSDIRHGRCLSDQVMASPDQQLRSLYNSLVTVNNALAVDLTKMAKELGNPGMTGVSFANTGVMAVLVAGAGLAKFSREGGAMVGVAAMMLGSLSHIAFQTMNMPSLSMSVNEAREFLVQVTKEQEELKAVEEKIAKILAVQEQR